MQKYFDLTAIDIEGDRVVLFGSFDKTDCKDELDAEKHNFKNDGYKGFKIVSRETSEQPDREVYDNLIAADIVESYINKLDQGLIWEWVEDGYFVKCGAGYLVQDDKLLSDIKAQTITVKQVDQAVDRAFESVAKEQEKRTVKQAKAGMTNDLHCLRFTNTIILI